MDPIERLRELARNLGASDALIWTCQACGQKNRVDPMAIIGKASQAKCGRCKATLRYEAPKR